MYSTGASEDILQSVNPRKLYHGSLFFSTPNVFYEALTIIGEPQGLPLGLLSSDVPASETPDNMYQQAPTYYIHTYVPIYTPIRSSVTVCTV